MIRVIYLTLGGVAAAASLAAQVTKPVGVMPSITRDARVKENIEKLAPPGRTSTVTGEVITQPGKKPEISLGDGRSLPVENVDSVEKLPKGAKFQFEVSSSPNGTTVRVGKSALDAVVGWEKSKSLLAKDDFKKLHDAYKSLDESLKTITATGAMGLEDPQFKKKIDEVHTELVKAYQQPEASDAQSRKEITERFAQVRDLRRKATFGRVDNYWPEVYDRIYKNSRASVAIARAGRPSPDGSGVLIGDSLVLTCLHVARIFSDKSQIRVWFDFESTSGALLAKREFEVAEVILSPAAANGQGDALDFALLLLKPHADGKTAQETYPPAVLSVGEPMRDDSIYVIGHPSRQTKMVHDNAFVLFPYRVSLDQMAELQMIVGDEIGSSPNKTEELKQFLDSYRALPGGAGYEQHSLRWYNSPVIAADCDTSHGNSGSGAWDRTTNKLIGILFAGEDDVSGESYVAGWRRHEAILPISVVITEIGKWTAAEWKTGQWKSDWRVDFNVKIE